MPSITAVSGQPTKNLGATIVNAGNTPASNDATNNNAGLGILTGSNSGKGSGSKVVERDGAQQSPASGILISGPGVQAATTARQFASPTAGATIAPGLPGAIGQIQRFNVSWKNIFRQHPTMRPPNKYNFYHNEYTASIDAAYLGANTTGNKSVKRDERAEFGTSIQLAKHPDGIMLSVGSPSGVYARDFGKSRAGYVDSWVFDLNKKPEFPAEEGTINEEGYAMVGDEECKWHPTAKPYHCPGWLNGFTRIGSRITQTSQSDEATPMPTFDKRRGVVVASGTGTGHCIAYNSDASRMAVGMPYANEETGEVRVYEFIGKVASSGTPREGRGIWARCGGLITGNQKGDRFGYSVALDGAGDTLFVGAPRPKGSGYVSVQEYSSNVWSGADMSSGVSPRDRYGYSVSCNEAGNAYSVGAPWGSGTRGYAMTYADFGGGWITSRRGKLTVFRQSQNTEQDNGKVKVQRIVGTASGERLGWSIDMMYKSVPSTRAGRYNLRVVVGSPYYSRSVAEYDFSKRTFAERAAGVPIKDIEVSESGEKPWHSQDYLENGVAYDKVGLSSEGKVQVWGYSGEEMTQTAKFGFTQFEWIHFGKSSSKTIMVGTQGSELGYSVKTSDDGDFLAAGAPGTPADYFDPTDCDAIEELDSSVAAPESGEAPPTTPVECDIALPEVHPKDTNIGTGAVRCYRYMWKGAEGDDARKQHFRSESDYFIKFGNTLRGVPNHFPYQYAKQYLSNEYFVRDHRYVRPNWQDSGTTDYPRCQPGERFGTSVALFAEFAIGNVMFPQLAVGAPYAMDIDYMNDSVAMKDGNGTDPTPFGLSDIKRSEDRFRAKYIGDRDTNFYMYRTGRADMFVGFPKLDGNLNMPAGAGRNRVGGKTIASRRTKPKFEYLEDGRKIIASGANDAGGKESYFIAPNVSGSGLANDNALKSSRKTFGTGGINFTSSD